MELDKPRHRRALHRTRGGKDITIRCREYDVLKERHVYHYRQKWEHKEPYKGTGLLTRHSFHYKNDIKQEDITPVDVFFKKLDATPPFKRDNEFKMARLRAYIILLYWTGLRKSEVYDLTREKFVYDFEGMLVNATRYKKRKREVVPLYLYDKMTGIPEVKTFLDGYEWFERPFRFSPQTAWHYVKLMDGKLYCHYWRLNRVTLFANDPKMTISKLKSWFAITYTTIEHYLGRARSIQKEMARSIIPE